MARYIDADALADEIVNTLKRRDYASDSHTYACFKTFIEILDESPTADVVEMVRCEDCKHFCEYSDAYKGKVEGADGDCYIRLLYSDNHQFNGVKYGDYCSYGEKENG